MSLKNKWLKASTISKIFAVCIAAAAVTAICLSGHVVIPLVVAGLSLVVLMVYLKFRSLNDYQKICKTAGIIFKNATHAQEHKLNRGACRILPTEHGTETELWREKLIAAAEHNIVLSGNYCGDKAFSRLLNCIEAQMDKKEHLKCVIISSPKFLKPAHRKKISTLMHRFNGRFSLVETPDIWHLGPSVKKATNHTKVMSIDYGRYFIQGGSGIKNNFVCPGIDTLSREDYLKKLSVLSDDEEEKAPRTILDRFLPGAFRDMDFVGKSKVHSKSVGSEHYRQALLLAYRWETYNKYLKKQRPKQLSADQLGIYSGTASPVTDKDSLVVRMLKEPIPTGLSLPAIEEFEKSSKSHAGHMQVLAQGPNHSKSEFGKQVLKHIQQATSEIQINHMYFHPDSKIFNALVEAAKRGVRITIISNGLREDAPSSHSFFVPRNRYNYNLLIKKLPEDKRGLVSVYEFEQRKMGNHKKVIVFDGQTVIAGSSNLGLKSALWSCDDELNFIVRSKGFAQEVLKVFSEDKRYCRQVTDFSISLDLMVNAAFQRLMAFLID